MSMTMEITQGYRRELHRERQARLAKWRAKAVDDHGIDLRSRHKAAQKVIPVKPSVIEPEPAPLSPEVIAALCGLPAPVVVPEAPFSWTYEPDRTYRYLKVETIQAVVATFFDIPKIELLSARRTANVVFPRQIAMYLAKCLTMRSLPDIGRRFGGRDHTTVLHAIRKMADMRAAGDPRVMQSISAIAAQLAAEGFDISPLQIPAPEACA